MPGMHKRKATTARSRPAAKRTVGRKAAKSARSIGLKNKRGMANSESTHWTRGGYARNEAHHDTAMRHNPSKVVKKLGTRSRAGEAAVANEYTRAAYREKLARKKANAARKRRAKSTRTAKKSKGRRKH